MRIPEPQVIAGRLTGCLVVHEENRFHPAYRAKASSKVQVWSDKIGFYKSPTLEPRLMETLLILVATVAMLVGPTLLVPGRAGDDEDDNG